MEFFPRLAERALAVELPREIFVRRESHRHNSAANVERSMPNVQRSIQIDAVHVETSVDVIDRPWPAVFSPNSKKSVPLLFRVLPNCPRRETDCRTSSFR